MAPICQFLHKISLLIPKGRTIPVAIDLDCGIHICRIEHHHNRWDGSLIYLMTSCRDGYHIIPEDRITEADQERILTSLQTCI